MKGKTNETMVKEKFLYFLLLCMPLLAMLSGCSKDKTVSPSAENGFNAGFGYVGGFPSRNAAFENDWASQKEVTLVTKSYKQNDRPVIETIDVPLPWAWDESPYQWLPGETARNMVEIDAEDWELAFNLTGVEQKPGEHFFGLYNRHLGILRVFYYLTEDRVPQSDANDHMWTMKFSKDLLEHVTFQYAIPYGEAVPETYKTALGGNDAAFRTTALTAECSDQGKVVPKTGWWAYDIDLSPMRPHDFFASDRSVIRPGMEVFNQDNVVLTSLMHGSLDGAFGGNMNLKSLKGGGASNGGIIAGMSGTLLSGWMTNRSIQEYIVSNGSLDAAFMSFVGCALGFFGSGLQNTLKRTGIVEPLRSIKGWQQ